MKVLTIGETVTDIPPSTRDDFAAWVKPHLPALRRYASRLVGPDDRDDVVQEALIRAWRRRSTFDPERGEPVSWLLAVVSDRARRHRARRKPSLLMLVDHDRPATGVGGVDLDLERAVQALPPRQRLAVDLYYFVGLDVAAVAATMRCAPGTVRATLHQARTALREQLGDQDD